TGGTPDGRQNVGAAQREEIPDLLRQRPEAEWRRQPGATPRYDRRCHPRWRVVLADRCPRFGGPSPPWRRHARIARQHWDVFRGRGTGGDHQLPAVAGYALCARWGYWRKGFARL